MTNPKVIKNKAIRLSCAHGDIIEYDVTQYDPPLHGDILTVADLRVFGLALPDLTYANSRITVFEDFDLLQNLRGYWFEVELESWKQNRSVHKPDVMSFVKKMIIPYAGKYFLSIISDDLGRLQL